MRELYLDENGYYHIRPEYSELARAWELLYNLHVAPTIQQLEDGINSAKEALNCAEHPDNETCQELDQQLEESKKKIWNSAIVVLYATGIVANISATYSSITLNRGSVCGTKTIINTSEVEVIAFSEGKTIKAQFRPGELYSVELDSDIISMDIAPVNNGVIIYYRTFTEIGNITIINGAITRTPFSQVQPVQEILASTSKLVPIIEAEAQTLQIQSYDGIAIAPSQPITISINASDQIHIYYNGKVLITDNASFSLYPKDVLIIRNEHTTPITIDLTVENP